MVFSKVWTDFTSTAFLVCHSSTSTEPAPVRTECLPKLHLAVAVQDLHLTQSDCAQQHTKKNMEWARVLCISHSKHAIDKSA